MILVTGGAGFIGGHFVDEWLLHQNEPVVVLDAFTYAGNPGLMYLPRPNLIWVHGNVCDSALLKTLFDRYQPRAVMHFAAETHVDRSIHCAKIFIESNIQGTFNLLEAARQYWLSLKGNEQTSFRYIQVSTDEVYGSLDDHFPAFTEESPHRPNNPYAATKAAGDHLARAWHHTHGLPVITVHSSNNYGPRQFPEKLIPHMLMQALAGRALALYGAGHHRRDWLYVLDHCAALRALITTGCPGRTYNVGSGIDVSNLALVTLLCQQLDQLRPDPAGPYARLITFGADRPGHDYRYAINPTRLINETGWRPAETLESGLLKTVRWHLHQIAPS